MTYRSQHAGPANFQVAQETGQEIMEKFRLQQGLLLTVRPDQPISLNIDQLRRLSWEEHAGVWRDYVNALAQCLVSFIPAHAAGVNACCNPTLLLTHVVCWR